MTTRQWKLGTEFRLGGKRYRVDHIHTAAEPNAGLVTVAEMHPMGGRYAVPYEFVDAIVQQKGLG